MMDAAFYRGQAERARQLARLLPRESVQNALRDAARRYDEVADDLEQNAFDVRHPELMPQGRA
jgi:hypothetical protein